MFLQDVVNRGSMPALEKMLAFTQARHQVLAENVANVDTPGYRTQQLDTDAFQASLRKALDRRKATRSPDFKMTSTSQFSQDRAGRLQVTPTLEPTENILFHDGTNIRVEKQMSMMAENAMMHQLMSELMRGKFEGLLKAIRGRM